MLRDPLEQVSPFRGLGKGGKEVECNMAWAEWRRGGQNVTGMGWKESVSKLEKRRYSPERYEVDGGTHPILFILLRPDSLTQINSGWIQQY